MQRMELTRQNYHSIEAEREYMSVSQFKDFMSCEAKAVARLDEKYEPPTNRAQLVGTYVHSAFESDEELSAVIEENYQTIFNTKGNKYADFIKADEMIETIKSDPFAMDILEGEREVIYTFKLFDIDWKMRVDSINHQKQRFSDLKTTRDLYKRYWSEKYNKWVSFVEAWDYVLQIAIYRKGISLITGENYTPYIVTVTKESPPNKAVLHFDVKRFDFELEYVEVHLPRMIKVKNKEINPTMCGACDYCRATKKITDTIEIGELI